MILLTRMEADREGLGQEPLRPKQSARLVLYTIHKQNISEYCNTRKPNTNIPHQKQTRISPCISPYIAACGHFPNLTTWWDTILLGNHSLCATLPPWCKVESNALQKHGLEREAVPSTLSTHRYPFCHPRNYCQLRVGFPEWSNMILHKRHTESPYRT